MDARTGRVNWSVKNGDVARGETSTGPVLPVKDLVIVGLAGGEMGARCHLSAYEAKTGTLRWRAWSNGPDADMLVDPATTTELGKPSGPTAAE